VITGSDWKRRLRKLGYREQPRAERRTPSGLAAMYGGVSAPKLGRIKKISSTGLYLLTDERWPVGEVISMTMQMEGPPESLSELQIDVQARVASHGEDGVGLGFVLPTGLDSRLWEILIRNADDQTETEHVLFIFRLVRTILFLCRLCPSGAQDAIHLLGRDLDEFRTKSAVEIALRAEKLLAGEPDADNMHAHPQIVASILRDGSWSNSDLVQQLWAGLLTSSCTVEGTDESNREFIELLVQVTEAQARILLAGCRKARELTQGAEGEPSKEIIITPEEMIQITGTYDLYRSATDVAYLFNFGLLKKVFDFTTYLPKDSFNITPSNLGLELFKVCRGS
jgi:PilZ domain